MPYSPTYPGGWQDFPDTSTPITATSLNTIESGISSVTNDVDSAWQSWTPSIGGTGWALGDAVAVGRYKQIGKTIIANASITFAAGSTFGAGNLTVSIPVTAVAASNQFVGLVRLVDTGTANFVGHAALGSTTTVTIFVGRADATYLAQSNVTSTVPFTWVSTDVLRYQIIYEAA
jgi:hypothetical protein